MSEASVSGDVRDITTGWQIPTATYSDQPFVVRTDDGAWLCCVTTGAGTEGAKGQHVTTMRSTDQGRTWSTPVPVEVPGGVENSYSVMLKTPAGRIYCFYNHNTDNVREILSHDRRETITRVDSLGSFVFKYSDDHGRSWSANRYPLSVREFACDRDNVFGGRIRFFWNVGKPFVQTGAAFVPLIKVGRMGEGFFSQSEGVLLKSPNLLTESDPKKITWETLPDGDVGLRTPPGGGPIAEEQSYCVLSDGAFYCVYRSIDGYPVETYSRDGGHTWSTPQYKRYADGRLMKHPRAANFVWRCTNGKYLYWFHNHGGTFIGKRPEACSIAYEDRNPVWLNGGVEADSPAGKIIRWSEPELLLYDDDTFVRMSYPDLVEEQGRYFITETQKNVARTHEIPADVPEGLWRSLESTTGSVAARGLIEQGCELHLPPFLMRDHHRADYGTKDLRAGLTVELWLQLTTLSAGQVLVDNRTPEGKGFCLQTTSRGTIEIVINDGRTENRWDCDPVLKAGRLQHVVVLVDGGPKIVSFIIDGRFCDGGEWRQFGWGRFNPNLREVSGEPHLRLGEGVCVLRLYTRVLRTAEAIGNYRAGAAPASPEARSV